MLLRKNRSMNKSKVLLNNEDGNTIHNLWGKVRALLRGDFIETQAILRKEEKSQIKNLNLYLKKVEKKN